MASTVYYSNRLEKLTEKLSGKIQNSPGGIFVKDTIITQTAGMDQWLAAELAKKENLGVFANFSILHQDEFINEVHFLLTGNQARFNKETGRWMLYELLGTDDFLNNPDFRQASEYCAGDDLKRIQLASRINDLFDQYQVYREGLIDSWENGLLQDPGSVPEKWQKWLWLKLKEQGFFHAKYHVKKDLLQALDDTVMQEKLGNNYPIVSFFGNSVYTRFHKEIYDRLAEIIDIDHYVLMPAGSMEGKFSYRNELLESFGRQSLDMLGILSENTTIEQLTVETMSGGLLSDIQNAVFNDRNTVESDKIPDSVLLDDSIQVNSTYTAAREVEILYNYMLGVINRVKGLNPRDILVLARDIDLYAPYIKAVFSNAPHHIPFKISGVSKGQEESFITALLDILDLEEEDFTSEKVISLLELKPVSARFGITDTIGIRSLVSRANIRFGKTGRKEDDTNYVSWDYGIKKLVYGYAMLSDQDYHVPGEDISLYPFEDIEGEGGRQVFRIKEFIDDLANVIDEKKVKKSLEDWIKFINEEVLDRLIHTDNSDKEDLAFYYKKLNNYREAMELLPGRQVEFRAFYQGLKRSLSDEPAEYGFNSGKVTFSSYDKAKGLPARVIAFLGLNNDSFPRKDRFVGYDLLGKEVLAGDRSLKENDKQRFLETILSARDFLYLSYIGRSSKDNSELPPSIVLDELLDYLEKRADNPAMVRDGLLVEHPLHGFSGKYLPGNSRLFTYFNSEDTSDPSDLFETDKDIDKEESIDIKEINLDIMIRFFQSPVKWYYQKFVGLYLDEEEDQQLLEEEVFDLNKLELWSLKNELVKADISDSGILEKARDEYVKSGLLPLKNFSIIEIEELRKDVMKVKEKRDSLIIGKSQRSPGYVLDLENGCNLYGSVNDIYSNELVEYSFPKKPLKYMIQTWIRYLFLTACDEAINTHFIDRDGIHSQFRKIDKKTAREYLCVLTENFVKGNGRLIPFTIKAAELYFHKKDLEKALGAVETEANGIERAGIPPDLYIRRALNDKQFDNLESFRNYLADLGTLLLNFMPDE